MRKSLFAISSAALVFGGVACADLVGLGFGNLVGEYDLQTLNGFSLPVVVFDDGIEQDELISERFTIFADGSYTDDYTLRIQSRNGSSTSSFRDVGTYTQFDTQLQFVDGNTGEAFNGEFDGRALTITQNGNFYVYRR
jgi:hypothetical protein